MKSRILAAVLALGAAMGLTTGSVHAQGVTPCDSFVCMAGMSGFGLFGGPGCAAATQVFFSINVGSPFDAGATAASRKAFLMTCPGADVGTNLAIVDAIIAQWGEVP